MIEINGKKIYSENDLEHFDQTAKIELLRYFFSTSVEERQNYFLVYNPKALRFWIVPVKEKAENNLKMYENGMSLRKYFEKRIEKGGKENEYNGMEN